VRYSNGEIQLTEVDLEFDGLGRPWGQTRSYSNVLIPQQSGPAGVNWYVNQIPYLLGTGTYGYGSNGTPAVTVAVVGNPYTASVYYLQQSGPQYAPQHFQLQTLIYDAAADQYVLTDLDGSQTWFYGFDSGAKAGLLRALVDASGNIITASYNANWQMSSLLRLYNGLLTGFYYDYVPGSNLLATVTLQVNGVYQRRVQYTYYGASDPNGLTGDLQSVVIQTFDGSSWQTVKTSYYRYYTTNSSIGYQHGLKYVVGGEAYAMMMAAGLNPFTATDVQVAAYADNYFQYDTQNRVTLEETNGGAYTYTFVYSSNGTSTNYNQWVVKTVETLPDASRNIVYCNAFGQVLFKIHSLGGSNWYQWYRYDGSGRTLQVAESSAVQTYSETLPSLAVLYPSSGLIRVSSYYTISGPIGYLMMEGVQEGTTGTPIWQKELIYSVQTVGNRTIYPIEMEIVYQNDAGTSTAETTYEYSYYPGTFQPQQKTTFWPINSSSQNGSGSSNSRTMLYDVYGNTTWLRNERGFLTNYTYDPITGGLIQQIDDVNTATLPAPNGWTTPAGGGLHLITDYEVDYLGRTTQSLGPVHTVSLGGTATTIRRAQWTVYQDAQHATWTGSGYATWTTPVTYTLINPVTIEQRDVAERVIGQMQATRASTSGALSATDSFPQSSWTRWVATNYNQNSLLTSQQSYFLIPSSGSGTVGTNYNEIDFGYDTLARQIKVVSPAGTITRQVLNPMGWVLSTWVGTNDAGATPSDPTGGGTTGNNMVQLTLNTYDGGNASGDGNLTTAVQYASASDARTTTYGYDFRDRRTYTDGEIDFYEAYTYDNVNRLLVTQRYDTTSGGNLVAKNATNYDNLGRVYQKIVYGVDPTTGTVGSPLTQNLWYDPAGNLFLNQDQTDRGFTKTSYDSLNRPSAVYDACNSSAQTYATAGTVAADTVVQQARNSYDAASNLVFQVTSQRDHNATGTGALNGPAGSQPQARVSYVAPYPDPIGRLTAVANCGTNVGVPMTPPSVVPTSSSTILVSLNGYDSSGNLATVTDPQGTVTQNTFDNAGRLTQTVENSGGLNKTTQLTYNPNGKIGTLTATNTATGNQVTTWNYGTTSTSDVISNELLASKVYPDSVSGSDQVLYLYNALGQVKQQTAQTGTVRQFLYDKLGRLTDDKANILGGGVDVTVQRISRTYEVRGMLQNVTSFTTPTGTTVVNDVKLTYNTYQQLANDYQSHSGAVSIGTTPKVGYAYASGSANTIRLNTITYPNGRLITYGYGAANGIDDLRDRVETLTDSLISGTAVTYSRFGLDRTVIVQYNEPNIEMTYVKLSGESNGDGGDQYTGLDRFNRVIDNRWINISTSADIERFKYTFSLASNRLTRQNTVAATNFDEQYVYDNLYEITDRKRGTLSGGVITGTPQEEEQFSFDPTGNWPSFVTKASGTTTLNQTRTAQKTNEISAISPSGSTGYDSNGNMTTMPQVDVWGTAQTVTYDAWNRPITVRQGATTLGTYAYDGLNRRTTKISTESGSTVTRHFYYSNQWQVLEERTGSTTSADRQYLWGTRYADDLVVRNRFSGTVDRLYALSDYFQTTSICNTSGVIQERYVYRAFGDVGYYTSSWSASSSSFGWTYLYGGYQLDPETNLYQVRNRYYHSALGRWLSRDPIEEVAGTNLYAYVSNNAVNAVDPTGLIKYKSAICDEIDREGCTCVYLCYCPYGYSLGSMSSIIKRSCDDPVPTPQCFKPEPGDYLLLLALGLGIIVITIASGGGDLLIVGGGLTLAL
jgi:RHS repeat-associated protein